MDYAVRDAREEDLDAAGALIARVYLDEAFSAAASAGTLRATREHARAAHLIVAVGSARVVGAVYMVVDGPLRQIASADEGEVRMLCVDPVQRGQGIAEALMTACIAKARAAGRPHVALSTQPTMRAAHRLYERLGFRRAPERDWRGASGRDMLVYTLRG